MKDLGHFLSFGLQAAVIGGWATAGPETCGKLGTESPLHL